MGSSFKNTKIPLMIQRNKKTTKEMIEGSFVIVFCFQFSDFFKKPKTKYGNQKK